MVHYSKRTFKYPISKEIASNHTLLNTYTMFLAKFLLQSEPYMKGVCFYLYCDLHRNVLNTKPLSREFCWLRYLKNNFDLSIFSVYFYIFSDSKIRKNLNCEKFGKFFKLW